MHEILVNRLRGLSLPKKRVVKLTDRPNITIAVYRGRKTTKQQSEVAKILDEIKTDNDSEINTFDVH